MIHYTLLPEIERRLLKREYRIRLFIFFLFFISCAILIGVFSLIPAYILSFSQEKDILKSLEYLQKNRKENGMEVIIKELKESDDIIKKLNENNKENIFSQIIYKIISHKNSGIYISSFQFPIPDNESTSTQTAIIQGRASSRESLISFKGRLESDTSISKVELPVSDLAKSKDISFSVRVSISSVLVNKIK